MKRIIMLLICCFALIGCSLVEYDAEKEMDNEAYLDELRKEIYQEAYEEGYRDGRQVTADAITSELPWSMIEVEELEEALYMIFDDAYAEEVRDQIVSYCKIYSRADFEID